MLWVIRRHYLPNTVIFLRPPDELSSYIVSITPFTGDLKTLYGGATAYIHTDFTCR
jgi:hypothetical protein